MNASWPWILWRLAFRFGYLSAITHTHARTHNYDLFAIFSFFARFSLHEVKKIHAVKKVTIVKEHMRQVGDVTVHAFHSTIEKTQFGFFAGFGWTACACASVAHQ